MHHHERPTLYVAVSCSRVRLVSLSGLGANAEKPNVPALPCLG
jgi:hypothetical protein